MTLKHQLVLLIIVFGVLFSACEEFVPVPKPRAYPRVVYPQKEYVPFNESYCGFTFEMPKYAVIERDTTFFEEAAKSDCWFNMKIPDLNAQVHCSYYPIGSRARYDELVQDAFTMATKHNIKASYIEEDPVHRPEDHIHGMIFRIEGPAASSYQFFLSDSTSNFFRGALYFETQAKPDSLAPVLKFVQKDIDHLVETLKWEK
jgi:gliding motility-associated lipoprotein GldD